jgi:hypothetical protein
MSTPSARRRRGSWLGAVLLAALSLHPVAAARSSDRLDRFRELASEIDPAVGGPLAEVYALLDGEIVESLAGGGVFASPAFLQDRLEAFTEVWGGLSVRLLSLARATVAAVSFTELPQGSTVRIYGRTGGEPALLTALTGDGWPVLRPLPATRAGARQFLVTWEGAATANGARPLRFDVVREEASGARVVWSSTTVFPEGLTARGYVARGSEITVRYGAHYPGWTPGCEGQTEYEDVYRLAPGGSSFARAVRREVNAWHRDVHAAAERLFLALSRGDRASLNALVPDAGLRARLPEGLRGESACDAPPGRDGIVAIAAFAAPHDPWTLKFRRAAGRWRLTGGGPTAP